MSVPFVVAAILVFAYLLFLASYLLTRERVNGLLPGDMLVCVMSITYGPWGFMRLSSITLAGYSFDEHTVLRTALIYFVMCSGLAFAFAVLHITRQKKAQLPAMLRVPDKVVTPLFAWLLAVAACLTLMYLSIPGIRQYVYQVLTFLKGGGLLSYDEIRRGTVTEDVWYSGIMTRGRYSYVAFIYCLTFVFAITRLRLMPIWLVVVPVFIVVCAINLQKMTYFLFSLYPTLICYKLFVQGRWSLGRQLALGASIAVFIVTLVLGLYKFQYRDAASVTSDERSGTAFHRVIEAHPMALALYADIFPNQIEYLYGGSNRKVASLFGKEYVDAPSTVGLVIGYATTFQAGFAGDAYADFGLIGVFVFSVVVGCVMKFATWIYLQIRTKEVGAAYLAHVGLNLAWTIWNPLFVALVTGGLLLCFLGYPAMDKWIQRRLGSNMIPQIPPAQPLTGRAHSAKGLADVRLARPSRG